MISIIQRIDHGLLCARIWYWDFKVSDLFQREVRLSSLNINLRNPSGNSGAPESPEHIPRLYAGSTGKSYNGERLIRVCGEPASINDGCAPKCTRDRKEDISLTQLRTTQNLVCLRVDIRFLSWQTTSISGDRFHFDESNSTSC